MKLEKFFKLCAGKKGENTPFFKRTRSRGRMASKQNKAAGGGSPTQKSQQQPSSQQAQSQKELDFEQLKDFISQALKSSQQDLKQEIKQEIKEVKEMVQEKYDKVTQKLMTVVTGLSKVVVQTDKKVEDLKSKVDVKLQDVDYKISNVENKAQRIENEITMMQFRSMEFAIRLRGIKESARENLRLICVDALALMLKVEPDLIDCKMDKVYRVNSWIAKQKGLPRDVVIYFTDRKIRNDILQRSFVSTVQIEGKEIGVYKELPPKMLRDRKDFGFLVKELKKQGIPFRWDAPNGIILRFQEMRYRLNTVEKAEEFYQKVFKTASTFPRTSSMLDTKESEREFEQETQEQRKQSELEAMEKQGAVGGFLEEPLIDFPPEVMAELPKSTREVALDLASLAEAKEQRITRAAYKQIKEQQQYQQRPKSPQDGKQDEAMGGTLEENLQQMFLSLQDTPNDN